MQLSQTAPFAVNANLLPMLFAFLLGIGVIAMLISKMSDRSKQAARRLELLRETLQRGDLDPETRRELVRALKPPVQWTVGRVGFALGWLGIFASGAWLGMEPRGDEFYGALFSLLLSIAVVTLPFALRELERGKPA